MIIQNNRCRGVIGILTGGGDVPGLNPAIRRIASRAIKENYKVIGIKRGWAGLVEMQRDPQADNKDYYEEISSTELANMSRTEEAFLHSSRTKPSELLADEVPEHLRDLYREPINDLTDEVKKNIEYLGIDYIIPVGGDDTLKYALRLHREGVKIIAIPKTMDGDVAGTDYCIGFSTCITRTIEMINTLSASAGSHERFMIIEVFGRYAGFTAVLPTLAGVANRCVIPEYKFSIDQLAELMVSDRAKNPGKYSIVVVSEGAMFYGGEQVANDFKHQKRSGIGEKIAEQLYEASAKFNGGKHIDTITQNLGYLVRSGFPDATDSIVSIAYANIALDMVLQKRSGLMTVFRDGCYSVADLDEVSLSKKEVDIERFYDTELLCPKCNSFIGSPLMVMTATKFLQK